MSQPTLFDRATEFLNGIGDDEAVAKHFGLKTGAVTLWKRKKQYPQKVFEAMYGEAMRQQEEQPAPQGESESPTYEEVQEIIGPVETDAKLNDLNTRISGLESGIQALLERLDQPPKTNLPASSVRPPGRTADRLKAAGIINPGIGSGVAPTRDEAHNSASGGKGRPAGPAEARAMIKRGDPGWNGRSSPDKRDGWNDPKSKPQFVQMWPSNR